MTSRPASNTGQPPMGHRGSYRIPVVHNTGPRVLSSGGNLLIAIRYLY
jgi:hypothetical protein